LELPETPGARKAGGVFGVHRTGAWSNGRSKKSDVLRSVGTGPPI